MLAACTHSHTVMPPKRRTPPADDGVSDLLFGFEDGEDDDPPSDGGASGDSRGGECVCVCVW